MCGLKSSRFFRLAQRRTPQGSASRIDHEPVTRRGDDNTEASHRSVCSKRHHHPAWTLRVAARSTDCSKLDGFAPRDSGRDIRGSRFVVAFRRKRAEKERKRGRSSLISTHRLIVGKCDVWDRGLQSRRGGAGTIEDRSEWGFGHFQLRSGRTNVQTRLSLES